MRRVFGGVGARDPDVGPAADQDRQRFPLGHRPSLHTRVLGSADGKPNVSATAGYTTFPSTTLRPRNSAGSSLHACFQPFRARRLAYGNVAFVSPSVEVRGTPPGMLATP